MSAIQMTMEQLQQLIEAVRSTAVAAIPAKASASPPTKPKRSFADCTARFRGQRDHNAVDEFITNMVTFKEVEDISDEDALCGLSLLFYDLAATWWQGVKREAKTWDEAIELIRSHFSPTKPAYHIYMDIAGSTQSESTSIHTFVCEKRALFAQLPEGRHDEETELDLIFGLLNMSCRKNIQRHDVKTFRDLLDKGRIIERNYTSTYKATGPS